MEALRFITEVERGGTLRIPPTVLREGTPVEVIILVREDEDDLGLLQAAQETLDFWDNPKDDEVWNGA